VTTGTVSPKSPRRRRPKTQRRQQAGGAVGAASYSKAAARVLDVLECFPDGETALSMTEISRLGNFPESSLFRILCTLTARGYLLHNEDGSYHLAPRLVRGKLRERAEVIAAAIHPLLRQLSNRFNETASTAFLFEDKIEVIDTIQTFHEIGITNTVGRVLQPYASSLGKAITAFQTREKINHILHVNGLYQRTENTVVDRLKILAEYERIRRQGYAEDRAESVLGAYCCGAPLRDEKGRVTAALSLSTPSIRMTPGKKEEIIRAVLDAVQEGERRIQASPLPAPGRGGGG